MADRLSDVLFDAKSRGGLFRPSTILVNNLEMGQWLLNRIGIEKGVCANVDLSLPGTYLWGIAAKSLCASQGNETVFPGDLKWLVLSALLSISEEKPDGPFLDLRSYMERRGRRGLYDLSRQLSFLFDSYLNYRMDMLEEWLETKDQKGVERWQAALWREVVAGSEGVFKSQLLNDFLKSLLGCEKTTGGHGFPPAGPLFLFGINQLPPIHLAIFSALGRTEDVHLFFPSPSMEYWADAPSMRRERRIGTGGASPAVSIDYFSCETNPLLSSMGRTGAEFLTLLLEECQEGVYQEDLFSSRDDTSMLGTIQNDLLRCRAGTGTKRSVAHDDLSVQIHCCHSPLREVEVLHDQLLFLFDHVKDLYPHDVAVMAPDISKYATSIRAVFGTASDDSTIPYSFCDMPPGDREAPSTFLSLMDACRFDLTAPMGMDLLSLPLVSRRYEMSEDDLELARYWIGKSGVRRGTDSDGSLQNSWLFGMNRLLASCLTSGDACLGTVIPLEDAIDGSRSETLGRLSLFVRRLTDLQFRFMEMSPASGPGGTVDEWRKLFSYMVRSFFPAEDGPLGDEVARLRQDLCEILDRLNEAGIRRVDSDLMSEIVEGEFSNSAMGYSFPMGEVVFSSLVPMRNIPFRVVCLLGMNDSDFPRPCNPPSYDLISRNPRSGDRRPLDEDRYLFLTILISAMQYLYISYTGRSQRDANESPPSCLVTELMEYLDQGFQIDGAGSVLDHVVTHHPLQPFSPRYAKRDERGLFTYKRSWFSARERMDDEPPFWPLGFSIGDSQGHSRGKEQEVDINDLASFFSNPARYLLRNGLEIDLYPSDLVLRGCEPVEIEDECENAFWSGITEAALSHGDLSSRDLAEIKRRLSGLGLLPHKYLGEVAWRDLMEKYESWYYHFSSLKERLVGPDVQDRPVYGPGGIKGSLEVDRDGEGLLILSTGKPYASLLVKTWLKHLLLCASKEDGEKIRSRELFRDGARPIEFKGCRREKAMDILKRLLFLYEKGKKEPLSLFASQSYALCRRLYPLRGNAGSLSQALRKAEKEFGYWNEPERMRDPWTGLILRGRKKELLYYGFVEASVNVFQPMLERMDRRP